MQRQKNFSKSFCGHSGNYNMENSVERIQVGRLPFQSATRTRNRIRFSFSTKTGLIKQSEQGKSAKQIFNFGIKVGSWVGVPGPPAKRWRRALPRLGGGLTARKGWRVACRPWCACRAWDGSWHLNDNWEPMKIRRVRLFN